MKSENRTVYSFLFFVATTLISIATISHGQGRKQSYSVSEVSMNYPGYINKVFNKQIIPAHQYASYNYLMMAAYFGRSDVALPGFAKYFRSASDRELGHVNFIMNYINKRGGYIDCRDIEKPDAYKWPNGTDAMEDALKMERMLNKEYLDLHRVATNKGDAHLKRIAEGVFLDEKVELINEIGDHTLKMIVEGVFLEEKVDLIKELGDRIAVLESMKRTSYGLGEYLVDKSLQ